MAKIRNYKAQHDRIHGVEYLWEHEPTGDCLLVDTWREGIQVSHQDQYYLYYLAAEDIPDGADTAYQVNEHYQRVEDGYYDRKDKARKAAVAYLREHPDGPFWIDHDKYAAITVTGETVDINYYTHIEEQWAKLKCVNCGTRWDAKVVDDPEYSVRPKHVDRSECSMCGPADIDHKISVEETEVEHKRVRADEFHG